MGDGSYLAYLIDGVGPLTDDEEADLELEAFYDEMDEGKALVAARITS